MGRKYEYVLNPWVIGLMVLVMLAIATAMVAGQIALDLSKEVPLTEEIRKQIVELMKLVRLFCTAALFLSVIALLVQLKTMLPTVGLRRHR